MNKRIIETHMHLSNHWFQNQFPYIDYENGEYIITPNGDLDSLIDLMKDRGIALLLDPAIDLESNERLLDLSEKHPGFIACAVGNHPTRTITSKWSDRRKLEKWAKHSNVVAIGEAGLDYHFPRNQQHRLRQLMWFIYQIKLADRANLPLVLHIREADKDAIRVLRLFKDRLHGGVCHCFGSGPDIAQIYTEELGFSLGIGGTLLMREEISKSLIQTVIKTPIEHLILETDSPYVKPEKPAEFSGKAWRKARNTSLILPAVTQRIAELKGMSCEDVERITFNNAVRVFDLGRFVN